MSEESIETERGDIAFLLDQLEVAMQRELEAARRADEAMNEHAFDPERDPYLVQLIESKTGDELLLLGPDGEWKRVLRKRLEKLLKAKRAKKRGTPVPMPTWLAVYVRKEVAGKMKPVTLRAASGGCGDGIELYGTVLAVFRDGHGAGGVEESKGEEDADRCYVHVVELHAGKRNAWSPALAAVWRMTPSPTARLAQQSWSGLREVVRNVMAQLSRGGEDSERLHAAWPVILSSLLPMDEVQADATRKLRRACARMRLRALALLRRGLHLLNDEQRSFVYAVADGPALVVLHGPPGTGKSHALAQLVKELALDQVLICAHSNAAVNAIARAVKKAGVEVFRLGDKAKASEDLLDNFLKLRKEEPLPLVGVFCCTISGSKKLSRRGYEFQPKLVVVDECAQVPTADLLSLLLDFAHCDCRVVLAGDPKQLEPVYLSDTAKNLVEETVMERLMQRWRLAGGLDSGVEELVLADGELGKREEDIVSAAVVEDADGEPGKCEEDMMAAAAVVDADGEPGKREEDLVVAAVVEAADGELAAAVVDADGEPGKREEDLVVAAVVEDAGGELAVAVVDADGESGKREEDLVVAAVVEDADGEPGKCEEVSTVGDVDGNLSSWLALFDGMVVKTLVESYRMHPDICKLVSDHSYEGRLEAHPSTIRPFPKVIQSIGKPSLPKASSRVRFVDVPRSSIDKLRELKDGTSSFRLAEALEVHSVVKQLHNAGVSSGDMCVLTPYKAQADKLRTRLPDGIMVSTVHAMQGSEKSVVIISTVSEFHAPKFVDDPRMFNVAVSRAKDAVIVVGCKFALARTQNWCIVVPCLLRGCKALLVACDFARDDVSNEDTQPLQQLVRKLRKRPKENRERARTAAMTLAKKMDIIRAGAGLYSVQVEQLRRLVERGLSETNCSHLLHLLRDVVVKMNNKLKKERKKKKRKQRLRSSSSGSGGGSPGPSGGGGGSAGSSGGGGGSAGSSGGGGGSAGSSGGGGGSAGSSGGGGGSAGSSGGGGSSVHSVAAAAAATAAVAPGTTTAWLVDRVQLRTVTSPGSLFSTAILMMPAMEGPATFQLSMLAYLENPMRFFVGVAASALVDKVKANWAMQTKMKKKKKFRVKHINIGCEPGGWMIRGSGELFHSRRSGVACVCDAIPPGMHHIVLQASYTRDDGQGVLSIAVDGAPACALPARFTLPAATVFVVQLSSRNSLRACKLLRR